MRRLLADSLASHPDLLEGLARFERERLPIARKAVAQGRSLGEYMLDHTSPGNGADDAHWREFHSIPGILKHTASSAFLIQRRSLVRHMRSQDLPVPELARNMRLIGHCDQGGRRTASSSWCIAASRMSATMFSKGFSVRGCQGSRAAEGVQYVPAAQNTWNIHLQTHDDLLLVINAKDMFAAAEFQDEKAYYKGELGRKVGTANIGGRARDWRQVLPSTTSREAKRRARSGSWRSKAVASTVYGIPAGVGLCFGPDRWLHRLHLHHYRHERSHPTEGSRAVLAARYERRGGRGRRGRFLAQAGFASPIVHGDTAYLAWRDAGMVILDVKDRAQPKLVAHKNGRRRSAAGTHNCLPLPDRDLLVVLDEAVLDHQEDGRSSFGSSISASSPIQ